MCPNIWRAAVPSSWAASEGTRAAKNIRLLLRGKKTEPFRYWDKGNLATIGRSRAVLEAGKIKMSGFIAWLAWLFIHILYLARFENRVLVLFQWSWNYATAPANSTT